MWRVEMTGQAVMTFVAIGMAVQHGAEVSDLQDGVKNIMPEECFWAAIGGIIGGFIYTRTIDSSWVDDLQTIIANMFFAFGMGPAAANLAHEHIVGVGNGNLENIGAGIALTLLFLPVCYIYLSFTNKLKDNPELIGGIAAWLWARLRGK